MNLLKGCTRDPLGRMLRAVITAETVNGIIAGWNAGMPMAQLKKAFRLGEKRIRQIVTQAGCAPRGAAWKPPPEYRIVTPPRPRAPRAPKPDAPGIRAGYAIKRTLTQRDPDYTDPDAKRLMRRYCPVHRACIVDPAAPADLWIVGTRRVSEREMRRMAGAV